MINLHQQEEVACLTGLDQHPARQYSSTPGLLSLMMRKLASALPMVHHAGRLGGAGRVASASAGGLSRLQKCRTWPGAASARSLIAELHPPVLTRLNLERQPPCYR
ncbi:hypothetical protein PEC18_16855 [Paucibacter sp. O1-1]|nr:hypothetical protein [Paucibacter sp. O1-1]MDA3827475.1 hypothetical protein [Paucibacter sp. O1-1]